MKCTSSLVRSAVLLTGSLNGLCLLAQESPYDLERTGWFVRTGAYIQMGMQASVSRNVPVQPVTPGIYDNGFVQKDISNGAQGLTWNWGYLESSQIVDGGLELGRVEGLSRVNSLDGFQDGTLFGPEVLVGFDFYQFEIRRRDAHLGFEVGLRFGNYSGNDHQSIDSDVVLQRDHYDLGGIVPPLPPYVGFPAVPGPLISLTPQPQTPLLSRATSSLSASMEADFYNARFGMWVTVPLTEKWKVGGSLGFTSIYAYGSADFLETVSYENSAFSDSTRTAHDSKGDWLPGAYAQLRTEYRFLPWLSGYVTVELAHNGGLNIDGLDYQARLDFGSTYGASGGLQFNF